MVTEPPNSAHPLVAGAYKGEHSQIADFGCLTCGKLGWGGVGSSAKTLDYLYT